MTEKHQSAAYGGERWQPRLTSTREELGQLWANLQVGSEWEPLQAVLLHTPGPEVQDIQDPEAVQWLGCLDPGRALTQHQELRAAYRRAGVAVHLVNPQDTPPPNLMFVADLMFMTPEGAILGRPASSVRAGEERWISAALAHLGVPILLSVRGLGTFEGADAAWINDHAVLLATGLRTNPEGAAQVQGFLEALDVDVIQVGLPHGTMHLMGCLRFADRDLAIAWPGRAPYAAVQALQSHGYRVAFIPDEEEAIRGHALNFVTLGPRRVLMAAGNPITQAYYEDLGIECHTAAVDELLLAAGGIACMTGVLGRSPVEA